MPTPKSEKPRATSNSGHNAKFEEIQKKQLEILKQRAQKFSFEDSDDEEIEIDKSHIKNLFKNYQGNEGDVARIAQFFESGENVDCLICIRQVKSKDKIWSCSKCYCLFHLLCIQKWANDSMCQKRMFYESQPSGYYTNAGVFIPKKETAISWDCPQCRSIYEPNEIPRHYECFCRRERDPLAQPFLVPHSCGEVCNQLIEPNCGHRCLLLCHPGPHPPCAQIIHKSCECKKSAVKTIRCSAQSWNCDQKCLKTLQCKVHKCEEVCHNGCPPCKKTSKRTCNCGSQTKEIKCIQESWSCQKVCKKKFPCSLHLCERKCHPGECGNCPASLTRTCFCGKQVYEGESCENFVVESCGDTCLKTLSCGNESHKCLLRCHPLDRSCGSCTELVDKKCRCGTFTKEFPCSKEFLCETKCKLLKNCKKHACNRKCCIECLPCDKVCGKALACGKHKCAALCHDGSCYPCIEKQKVKCRCGTTSITVLCGRAKKAPKCTETCKIPSKCHHEAIPHKCHFGECEKCVQTCGELLDCNHPCLVKCHDFIKVVTKDKTFVPKLPGEVQPEKIAFKKLPHPPCETKIPVICLGGHETSLVDCSKAKMLSCGRKCGRLLLCQNHVCQKDCHSVHDVKGNEQDENCEDCDSPCTIPRPKGCTHPCPKSKCHQGSCKRCHVQVKVKCFCGLTDVYYRCCDVHKRDLDQEEIEFLKQKHLSCGLRCIKNYPQCGHQCVANCHLGPCPNSDDCKKKVKLTCLCKTRKVDSTCDKVRAEKLTNVECDENCTAKKLQIEEQKQLELSKKIELEAEKDKRELELYEKKFGKKKFKERKTRVVEETKDNTNLIILATSAGVVLFAVLLYCTIF